MSQGNVELHRRANEAFNARDVEAYVALCDPEIELHSAVTVPGGGLYRGHEGVRQWHRDIEDSFGDDVRVEPEAYFEADDTTMTVHTLHGRGRQSGADVETPAAHVCRWRDGLIVYFRGYLRTEDAFRDLGVSKDELEPIYP
jgi:ketosteroid isomerase-like protein